MRFRLRNTCPIAVDLGATTLRAVQLEQGPGGPSLRQWLHMDLPRRTADGESDSTAKPPPPITPTGRTVTLHSFLGRDVVTSLGPPEVEVCSLRVPTKLLHHEKDALVRSIRHEVARHVSVSVEAAELDVWPLPPGQGDGPNLMVAVAPQAAIQQVLQWIDSQGCTCVRIDVAPLAMMRACARMMRDVATDRLWGVLDIGLRSSRLYLGLGETPVYVRGIRVGGDLMTRRIMNELGVDLALAERYKRHYGIRAESGGYRPILADHGVIDDERMASILLGALTPIVRGMAQDIEKSFRYGMDLYPGLGVSELILAGGGGNLAGLPELLAKALGIRVRRASADRLAANGSGHPAPAEEVLVGMVTCLGLCFAEMSQ